MSSDSCNQIIVIGNGFDKACGLPSSYGEYFNDRFQKYEVGGKILPSLQKAIEEEGIGDIPSLWDLLFAAFHDEETPFPRWMDVESAIRNYLWPSAGVNGHSFDSTIGVWRKFFIKRAQGTYEDFQQAKKQQNQVECIMMKYISQKHAVEMVHQTGQKSKDYNLDDLNWSETRQAFIDDDTPKMLLDELNRFEEDFGIYLYKAVELANENDDKYNSHAEHLYRCIGEYDCLVPIARQKNSVVSFNYTTPLLDSVDDEVMSSLYIEQNVHGTLPKVVSQRDLLGDLDPPINIIFGIDGYEAPKGNRVRRFTKTARKLSLPRQELPNRMRGRRMFDPLYDGESIQAVKVYGHSLGEADYSYFHALFDQIDLYESDTVLYFLYSTGHETIPEAVGDLLDRYGESLRPKAHGKNLLHKLMMEDRIRIANLDEQNQSI